MYLTMRITNIYGEICIIFVEKGHTKYVEKQIKGMYNINKFYLDKKNLNLKIWFKVILEIISFQKSLRKIRIS